MTLMAASHTHVRRFTCAAASACLYSARLVPQPVDLIKWVQKEGGHVHHSIRIASLEGDKTTGLGLGLVASEDIPKGTDLISLPHHIPLKFEAEDRESSALFDLARHIPKELWAMKLGLKLLQERSKKGSFWWPYISNLPETYSLPIFFPGEDIKKLEYAPLLHQINKRCRFLLDYEKLLKNELENVKLDDHPFGGHDVDASSLGWAMSSVSSRAFRLHGNKHDGTHVNTPMMLPLIDMCNHSFRPTAEIVQARKSENENALVKVVSKVEIKQDDPIELNYGCLNNDLFLLDYGFVVPSNPYDCIELKYEAALLDAASMALGSSVPIFSSPSAWKKQILSKLDLDGENSNLKVRIGGLEIVEDRLLAAVRVLLCKEKEAVEAADLDTLKSMKSEAPLGISNEKATLRTLALVCVMALKHFPTDIADDEAMLKQEIPATTELAIRYRIQKKDVIIGAMKKLSRKVHSLNSKQRTAAQ